MIDMMSNNNIFLDIRNQSDQSTILMNSQDEDRAFFETEVSEGYYL